MPENPITNKAVLGATEGAATASESAQKAAMGGKAPNIAKQQEGMRQTAGQENWDQAWRDVRKARSTSADAYRASRQKRFSSKYPQ